MVNLAQVAHSAKRGWRHERRGSGPLRLPLSTASSTCYTDPDSVFDSPGYKYKYKYKIYL